MMKTQVRRFLEVHREPNQPVHVLLVPDVVISTNLTEKKPSGLTPIHPSLVVKLNSPKFRPLQAAGIFPRKNISGAIPKSRLPVPVKTKSSNKQAKLKSAVRKGKSSIPVLANQHAILAPRIAALKKRERELLLELMKTRADRERVEELHRKLLVETPTMATKTPINKSKRRSKSLALDSPFDDGASPNIGNMSPLLLSVGHSRNPGSIYENYRRAFSFLQTPARSTFKQSIRPAKLQNDNNENVSCNVQTQLVHLFH